MLPAAFRSLPETWLHEEHRSIDPLKCRSLTVQARLLRSVSNQHASHPSEASEAHSFWEPKPRFAGERGRVRGVEPRGATGSGRPGHRDGGSAPEGPGHAHRGDRVLSWHAAAKASSSIGMMRQCLLSPWRHGLQAQHSLSIGTLRTSCILRITSGSSCCPHTPLKPSSLMSFWWPNEYTSATAQFEPSSILDFPGHCGY